jgi:glyoxylase-like metal-dependent hydrolase (beta-lactamase superfamily II)
MKIAFAGPGTEKQKPALRRSMIERVYRNARIMFALMIMLIPAALALDELPRWKTIETATHRFREIAPGVYFVTGTGRVFVHGNCMVIVNDSDTMVVDSHVSPSAGRALIESIKKITDKPIRFLVNTHFHYDHVFGNQAFAEDVAIVGSEATRENLLSAGLKGVSFLNHRKAVTNLVDQATTALAKETDPTKKARLQNQLLGLETRLNELDEARPTPPTVTFEKHLTFHKGNRTIQLICFGRGHTSGDVVVFLPKEKVIFTGDFLLKGPAYMGDAYIDEWIDALERLKALDFEWILPGHGEPFRDRTFIDAQQTVLKSLWDQLAAMRKQGIPPQDAIRKVDLTQPLSVYSALPLHVKNLEPRIGVRLYQRFEELEKHGSR